MHPLKLLEQDIKQISAIVFDQLEPDTSDDRFINALVVILTKLAITSTDRAELIRRLFNEAMAEVDKQHYPGFVEELEHLSDLRSIVKN